MMIFITLEATIELIIIANVDKLPYKMNNCAAEEDRTIIKLITIKNIK